MNTEKEKLSEIKERIKNKYPNAKITGLKKQELIDLENTLKNSKSNKYFIGSTEIKLNDEQKKVVNEDISSNIRIIACAGSGKTTTIVCRIKYLIDNGVESKHILLTTFNVDAAQSLRNRINSVFGYEPNITIGTMDSISARFYYRYFRKDYYVGVSEYAPELLNFLKSSEGYKITKAYKYFFFDEFQDCNDIQFNIIKEFHKAGCKIIVIGDDAQNIYQWRGSNIEYILNFDKYVSPLITHKLVYNYRSTPEIINISNNSIKLNPDQIPKEMLPTKISIDHKPTIINYDSDSTQAKKIIIEILKYIKLHDIPLDEIAIISRNNQPLKVMEEALEKHNYNITHSKKIFNNKDLEKSITINNKVKLENYAFAESSEEEETDETLLNYVALITDDKGDVKPKILPNHLSLTTIHKAKGLEWSVVFLISANDDKFPAEIDKISIQEERRLFYVALTRAKKYLHISFTSPHITRFIKEIDQTHYNFMDFKPSYFDSIDQRNKKYINDVTGLIDLLEPKDIQRLRNLNILLETNPNIINLHDKHIYDETITKYYLQADFGIFIDRYITRLIGCINDDSNGKYDKAAERVLNSLKINYDQYLIYNKYKYNIQKKILMLKNVHESKYISFIDKKPSDNEFIKKIDYFDYKKLENLLITILKNPSNIDNLLIIPTNFLPPEFHIEMLKSFTNYKSDKSNNEILKDIYNVSLCENISDGRRRMLYKNVSENFIKDGLLFSDIDKYVNKLYGKELICKQILIDEENDIVGELDLLNLTDGSIIDFKCSLTSDCKLEWIIQLLAYTSLLKKTNPEIIINKIEIYNPLLGTVTHFDISNWKHHNELLKFLSKLRK
jgi:superfamily I DNA and RNA helicase